MSDSSKSSPKKSVTWGDTQKQRFIKQHGSVDEIPDGDAHQIPKYESPVDKQRPSDEETKAAEDVLQKKLEALQNQGKQPVKPEKKGEGFYDEWED
jgi:hypothetical protein